MQRLIPAFGDVVFNPMVSAEYLYRAAQRSPSSASREAVEEYVADLTTILALPTVEPVRDLPWSA